MISEDGYKACAAFLARLEQASGRLHVPAAPRIYRNGFSMNYRALFPDFGRHYKVDLIEASFHNYAEIEVNGSKFEFSAEIAGLAESLREEWSKLLDLLRHWRETSVQPLRTMGILPSSPANLRDILTSLDSAWAAFEHQYVTELIEIEEKARQPLTMAATHDVRLQTLEEAVAHDKRLQALEEAHGHSDIELRKERQQLVRCISLWTQIER